MKSELWWASIGGHRCEPIRVTLDDDGAPSKWFSIGCSDAHSIGPGMTLVEKIEGDEVPLRPQDAGRQRRLWEREHRNVTGYRRFA